MGLKVSSKVKDKLWEKHNLTITEVKEGFANRTAGFLDDTRADHKTDPPTRWFVSETDRGKRIKIIFIYKNDNIIIKSAYPPELDAEKMYSRFAPAID